MFKNLLFEINQQIAKLTLNRPEALNALNGELLAELHQAMLQISEKSLSEVKVLIVTGSGGKAFVAGADIKEINRLGPEAAREFAQNGQKIFRQLERLKIPVIAAVNGFALGGGLELALACDFIYCSDNAKFALPEVSLGLIPGFGGTVRLARAIGPARAKEMIFSANMISAAEALNIGLVNKVTSQADLLPTVLKIAETISSRGPLAVAEAKQSVNLSYDQEIDEAMTTEAHHFARLFSSLDVKEGTSAFIEKRKAQFQAK